MRRVLVPLNGSAIAEQIIPEARRLAGPEGKLILVHDASIPDSGPERPPATRPLTAAEAESYLNKQAETLRAEGVQVSVKRTLLSDIAPLGIDHAARLYRADIIALATHGRSPMGRLVHGGTAWRAVAGSTIPVLLLHANGTVQTHTEVPVRRRILVPLDGSPYAEKAIPVAQELALEWNASIVLIRVIPIESQPSGGLGMIAPFPVDYEDDVRSARDYLERIASSLQGDSQTCVYTGTVLDSILETIQGEAITDVVMASHGRTGLSRVILGSVADSLIHELRIPVILIPALARGRLEEHDVGPQVERNSDLG
jgi:nucleotide-binding universal stress UspA family protein